VERTKRSGGRLARLALVLAGLAGLAGAAEAQYFGQNKVQYRDHDWRSISSDHFEVYFDTGADSLAMRTLDLAEKTQALFSRRFGHTLSRRIPIILYASHHQFSQTNITPDLIDGSTGGFTEALRDRVVVPFSGSYEDFRHVLVHELVHAYQFDLFYNAPGISLLSGQGFYQVPLWFAEGMAEYFSLGMEPGAEMFVRDGSLTGYLPPLEWSGGYLVYKMGQSALDHLITRHGEERFRDLLKRVRQMRSFERAFQRTYGLSTRRFDEQWRETLRKRYWPTLAKLDHPDAFAKRLTDHRRDESALNHWPSVSPQGDRIAYFSDRRQYTDVFLMSAFDGRPIRRVIRGERNVNFEAFPLLRTSIAWSPDGERLAFVAGSRGRDRLYVVDAAEGKVLQRLDVPCDQLSFPAWAPDSDSLVVLGLKNGRSDLWIVHARTGESTQLTDDAWDEKEPTWTPDGKRITFASDRLAPVVLSPLRPKDGFGRYAIFEYELASGSTRLVLDTAGDDHGPAWAPDGRRLVFISDRSGAPNLWLFDPADSSVIQLTDLTGGVQSVSWSRQNDRLVFAAFDRGGYDIFAVQEPLTLDPVVKRLRRNAPAAVLTLEQARDGHEAAPGEADSRTAALYGAWPDSATVPDTTAGAAERRTPRASPPREGVRVTGTEPPPWDGGGFPATPTPPPAPDTALAVRVARTPLVERGGPFALSDSVLGQTPARYRWRLAPEAIQVGALAASSYGFAGSTQLLFSDFLGDHSLYLAGDVFSNSLSEINALVLYSVLPRRLDWSVGAFHFKNYYDSQVTSLGEQLGSSELFSERTFGVLTGWSYPFDRFRRVEAQFTQMFVEEEFFERLPNGSVVSTNREYRSASSPSISLVGDHALWGSSGPVNGSRWNLSYSPAFAWFPNALAYHTGTFDFRRYHDLSRGYSFATRFLGGMSGGRDRQAFRVGGFSTVRGYPDFDLIGTRLLLGNLELRFPFVEDLGVVGPLPIGRFRLRGAVFADIATIWNEGVSPRFWTRDSRGTVLVDPYFSFGTGIRTWFLGLPMKLDVAWATDLNDITRPRWHFSIGPEF
jgi:Tol biopolymer transport system component